MQKISQNLEKKVEILGNFLEIREDCEFNSVFFLMKLCHSLNYEQISNK